MSDEPKVEHRTWCGLNQRYASARSKLPDVNECVCGEPRRRVEPLDDCCVDGLEDDHFPDKYGECRSCGHVSPCQIAQAVARIIAERKRADRAEAEVARLRRGCCCCAGSRPLEGADDE